MNSLLHWDQALFLVILIAIPVGMIAAGIWFVMWYAQRKVARDLKSERAEK